MPKGIAKLVNKPAYTWVYQIDQKRTADTEQPEVWIRGKGLGGSSAINGMIWSRGQAADYDAWQQQGCTGWDWQTFNSALKAIEDHQLGPAANRGTGGQVTISPGPFRYPLVDDMLSAAQQQGLNLVDDLNDSHEERVGLYSHNTKRGRRVSAAKAFIDPIKHRKNLTIATHTFVRKVLFEGNKAVGVEVSIEDKTHAIYCNKEIILSAGALETPRLLQLSGIGPQRVLEYAGVNVVAHSPDVGRRMREHLAFAMSFRLNQDRIGNQHCFYGLGLAKHILQQQLFGTGALSFGPFEVGGFAKIGDAQWPNLQLYLSGYVFKLSDDNHPVPLSEIDKQPGLSLYGQLLDLQSESEIKIISPDPNIPAVIEPNWLSHPQDQQRAIQSLKYMRQLAQQPALSQHIDHEMVPGPLVQTDEEILEAFKRLATCGLHATGSCRMGGDEQSVLDPELKVRGVTGLRVADCSAMPGNISGNTNAPAMALGYRAAQIIQDHWAS
ncbi:GMC family oxidoreductase N-terminal domain-containing protein [Halioxenophilus aromaticivorans]